MIAEMPKLVVSYILHGKLAFESRSVKNSRPLPGAAAGGGV